MDPGVINLPGKLYVKRVLTNTITYVYNKYIINTRYQFCGIKLSHTSIVYET